jgi:hypothetical protein
MDRELRLRAVKDVLEYRRKEVHWMEDGRLLAPILLRQAPAQDDQNDDELAIAMENLLRSELEQLRQYLGVEQPERSTPLTAAERIQHDLKINHPDLAALSLTWAYHIDHIPTAELARIVDYKPRTINDKVAAGRAAIAEVLERRERALAQPSPSIIQPDQDQSASKDGASDRLGEVIVLFLVVAAGWLVIKVPYIGGGALILVTCWRGAVHIWRGARVWRRSGSREDAWWALCYTLAWLALGAWSLSTLFNLPAVLVTPTFSIERAMFSLRCLSIGGTALLLGSMDLLFWVAQSADRDWPWHLLAQRATWAWQQRWLAAGLAWLTLIALSLVLSLPQFGIE